MSNITYRSYNIVPITGTKDSGKPDLTKPEENGLIQPQGLMVGHAAIFDTETDIGCFFSEMIDPGAFDRALKENHDVRALINHDPNLVLGRVSSGTLTLETDERGLMCKIKPPDTTYADNLKAIMLRGDVNQMSFAFLAKKETWIFDRENKLDLRIILDLELLDVSIVTYPAYKDTEVYLRSAEELHTIEREKYLAKKRAKRAKRAKRMLIITDLEGQKGVSE